MAMTFDEYLVYSGAVTIESTRPTPLDEVPCTFHDYLVDRCAISDTRTTEQRADYHARLRASHKHGSPIASTRSDLYNTMYGY